MTAVLYRRYAAECLLAAQNAVDPQFRLELLTVAKAWADLAKFVEQWEPYSKTEDPEH